MNNHAVAVLVVSLALLAGCGPSADIEGSQNQTVVEDPALDEQAEQSETGGEVVEVSLTGENFVFLRDGERNPTLRVQQGDTVRVTFASAEGFHDFVVDEFDASTSRVMPADGATTVEFVADETGTFEYYCSVGSHRQNGMRGQLVVE